MTYEQRIICGLEEIKAIAFECKECKSRVTFIPGTATQLPAQCPNHHSWDWNTYLGYQSTESPHIALLSALKKLSDPALKEVGFKVFIEFEKPKD